MRAGRLLLVLIAAIGLSSSFVVADTLAVFTAQAVNEANAFTAGSVAINDAPDSAFLTIAGMAPGDSLIEPLTIANAGSLELRYAMSTATTNDDGLGLAGQLLLTVRTRTASPCSAEDGSVLYGPAALSAAAVGDATQGAQAGDRTLISGSSEDLCFRVELPLNTPNGMQGAATVATFTFDAEQTANNP